MATETINTTQQASDFVYNNAKTFSLVSCPESLLEGRNKSEQSLIKDAYYYWHAMELGVI